MDWAKKKTDTLSDETLQNMLKTEQGGMTEVFADIYAITQKPDHLVLAKRFDHKMLLESMTNGKDNLTGLHANTQIPKMIGAAREYEVTAEPSYMKAAEFFWDCVPQRGQRILRRRNEESHLRDGGKQRG